MSGIYKLKLCELYMEGKSVRDIARIFGKGTTTIRNHLINSGVSLRDSKTATSMAMQKYALSQNQIERIKGLYLQNQGCALIARELDIDQGTVVKYVKRAGLQRDNPCAVRSIRRRNFDFFDVIDTEEKAYWLGFLYADGHVHLENYTIALPAAIRDADHIYKFASLFDNSRVYTYKTPEESYKESEMIRCDVSNKYTAHALLNKGITTHRTQTEDISVTNHISGSLANHFARGFIDGDGSIFRSKFNNYLHISACGCIAFLEWLRDLFYVYCGAPKNVIYLGGTIPTVAWSCANAEKIVCWLNQDSNLFLKRKRDSYERKL